MRVLRPAVLLLVPGLLAVAAFIGWPARSALACSPPQPHRPIDDATLIVAGRVAGWTIETSPGGSRPVSYLLAVDQVLKGDGTVAGASLRVDDAGISYDPQSSPTGWVSSNSLCGTFAADPTDAYLVVGLEPATTPGYDYESSWPSLFYLGSGPGDPQLAAMVEQIEARLAAPPAPPSVPPAPGPPDVGTGRGVPSQSPAMLSALAGATLAVGSGLFLACTRRRPS
jgi:hypothetical protein